MSDRAKGLSEILHLVSVLVATGQSANSAHERACLRDVLVAQSALRRAVSRAARRQGDADPSLVRRSSRRTLTPRERQIVRLLGEGASYKAISAELGMTFSTAQSRVKSIYAKLGVHSKAELIHSLHSETDPERGSSDA
jgi:DNA-binding NarL/FixJ family response regulator